MIPLLSTAILVLQFSISYHPHNSQVSTRFIIMARRNTKDPRRIMDILMSAHNNVDAPDDSNASDMNAPDDMDAPDGMDALERMNAPVDAQASGGMHTPKNTATPQTTARPESPPDPNEASAPNTLATTDGEPESPGLRQRNFFDKQNHVFGLLYDKLALFRTQLAALVASIKAQLTAAINTIDNTSASRATKARQKYRTGGKVMLIKVFLLECARHAIELDGIEGQVRTMEWEVRECEKGEEHLKWKWGEMADYLTGRVDRLVARNDMFGVCKTRMERWIEGAEL
jgi:hypothetical protein